MQKWRPRKGAGHPQRGPQITKILKQRYPKKRYFFEPYLGVILNSFGEENIIQNHENLVNNEVWGGNMSFLATVRFTPLLPMRQALGTLPKS